MILKRKDFARWQSSEKLPDSALCKAVEEMESSLIDADLGVMLYKMRIARPGSGKSGGFRSLLSARIDDRYVFLHGFAKSDRANITQDEKKSPPIRWQGLPGTTSTRFVQGAGIRGITRGAL